MTHEIQKDPHDQKTVVHRIRQHPLFIEIAVVLLVAFSIGTYLYFQDMQGKIYIEKAEIRAPLIAVSPTMPGVMDKLYVEEGQQVSMGQKLAKVGDETIVSKTEGIVIGVKNTPGAYINPHETVVTMIDRRQLRLVGRVAEDKGLKDIQPGQKVRFTVDAFGPKEYSGMVESVADSARQADIVFSISDKREEREFEVTAIFDMSAYQELKNGMSAKMWIYR
ncbi:MAG: efflux RND transporter periplasmic adaptor subunit [Candidatus Micrarchaeia archaeon]